MLLTVPTLCEQLLVAASVPDMVGNAPREQKVANIDRRLS